MDLGAGGVEGRWVSAGAAAPVQALEKPRLGAGEQQPERSASTAGTAAPGVLASASWRGLGLIGAVLRWGLSSVPADWAARADHTLQP